MTSGEADSRYVRFNANGTGSFGICPEAYALCPNCFNIEPWMNSRLEDKVALSLASTLADESFPTVYLEGKDAENWARKIVSQKMARIEEEREDESVVEHAKTEYYHAKHAVDDLNHRIQSIPGFKELESIKKQIEDLQAQQKETGAFKFKAKKEIKDALAKLSADESDLSQKVNIYKNPLDSELYKQQDILEKNQMLAFGCKPDITVKSFFTTFCYRYVPNDPPRESFVEETAYEASTFSASTNPTSGSSDSGTSNQRKPIFCHKCGSKLLSNSAFCSFCGAKLE